MIDIQQISDLLQKSGLLPSILTLGGWIYIPILLLVLLYYFIIYIKSKLN